MLAIDVFDENLLALWQDLITLLDKMPNQQNSWKLM